MDGHGLWDMFGLWDRNADSAAAPLTDKQSAVFARNVPYLRRLSPDAGRRLRNLTQTFLAERTFEGCDGVVVTDEMRVTIAARACVLLAGLDTPCYPGLRSVLVYPGAYQAPCRVSVSAGAISEGVEGRSGESWRGLVVLAWEVVRRGPAAADYPQNLVLHEFAHHFAEETGAVDGIPLMRDRRRDAVWRETLTVAHARLAAEVAAGRPALLRPYGATNTHEFFAVLTEAFFEGSAALKRELPELYGLMREFYRQDPANTPAV